MSEPTEPRPDTPPPYGTQPGEPSPQGPYPPPPVHGAYPPQAPYGQPGGYPPPPYGQPGGYPPPYGSPYPHDPAEKSKIAAGLLGIFLGGFGIHRFYLGYTGIGLTMLLVGIIGGVLTFGILWGAVWLWGFIEGILYLVASPGTSYSHDSTGRPLRS
ncbi:TM2 domain-containing protein [Cellulomonas sp. URHE0023]|uniref:TM2 domain-containing protein n=1 Tax=Cellulomonas sp. URHE0023 TaxID=1380354 RepID=UPI000487E8EE|nr:TM2 domain-containing protein [Cellulomonas sp. URHE0023]